MEAMIEHYCKKRIVPDSGGPGRFRGGVSHEYAITPHSSKEHDLGVILFGKGVRAPMSTGLFGGYPGCNVGYNIFRESNTTELPYNLGSTKGEKIEDVQWGVYDLEGKKRKDILLI